MVIAILSVTFVSAEGKKMLKVIKYLLYMVPVLWTFFKDLIWESLDLGEIKTNYLFGKANAYDRADLLRRAVRVYKEILRKDPNSIAVFLNVGGLYYRRGMLRRPSTPLLRKSDPVRTQSITRDTIGWQCVFGNCSDITQPSMSWKRSSNFCRPLKMPSI